MTIADALVVIHYKFTDPHAMEDPSPETLAATKDCNRQLVQDLQGTYMYRDYRNISDIADICRHPIFQQLLNKAFFAKTGINRRAHYFKGLHALPKETLGLMMDSIMCGIDRWNTGEHNPRSAPFDAKTYAPIHAESIRFLDAWMGEYQCEENGHPVDLSATCLREMLSKARYAVALSIDSSLTQFMQGGSRYTGGAAGEAIAIPDARV
ncbi:hypothetical protein DFH09DRAFT_376327 [Mycena vulgaris]|nr:hypothetical protein DFH09DRAFT_376327 [Mycena vulgaris]